MVLQLNWQKLATKAAYTLTIIIAALSPDLLERNCSPDSLYSPYSHYSAYFFQPCQAAPVAKTSAPPQPPSAKNAMGQIVNFPKGFSIGTLTIRQIKNGPDRFAPLGPAQGRMVFNYTDHYALDANHLFFLHPEVLKDIPPDCLDSITMTFSSFDDAEDGLCDKAMKHVAGLTGLKKLNLDRSEVTDAGLSQAKSLVNLECINLFSTLVKGKAFKDLTGLKKLHTIKIQVNELTPQTYEYFSRFPKLKTLDVARCHPNEQGIRSIAKCTNLTDLDISGNYTVNDRNIKYLTSLKQLKSLRLFGTNVSLDGLAQLKDLPLKLVVLTETEYDRKELDALRKVFPHTKLIAKKRGKLSGHEETIFAPLH